MTKIEKNYDDVFFEGNEHDQALDHEEDQGGYDVIAATDHLRERTPLVLQKANEQQL